MAQDPPSQWLVALGIAALVMVAGGWFLLSWAVLHTAAGDAFGESLGVVLGLLVAVSAVGVARSHRGRAR